MVIQFISDIFSINKSVIIIRINIYFHTYIQIIN
jgi:hypothetical protein